MKFRTIYVKDIDNSNGAHKVLALISIVFSAYIGAFPLSLFIKKAPILPIFYVGVFGFLFGLFGFTKCLSYAILKDKGLIEDIYYKPKPITNWRNRLQ